MRLRASESTPYLTICVGHIPDLALGGKAQAENYASAFDAGSAERTGTCGAGHTVLLHPTHLPIIRRSRTAMLRGEELRGEVNGVGAAQDQRTTERLEAMRYSCAGEGRQ